MNDLNNPSQRIDDILGQPRTSFFSNEGFDRRLKLLDTTVAMGLVRTIKGLQGHSGHIITI
jgi:hypothetical protein